jgi:hypothetical protein
VVDKFFGSVLNIGKFELLTVWTNLSHQKLEFVIDRLINLNANVSLSHITTVNMARALG